MKQRIVLAGLWVVAMLGVFAGLGAAPFQGILLEGRDIIESGATEDVLGAHWSLTYKFLTAPTTLYGRIGNIPAGVSQRLYVECVDNIGMAQADSITLRANTQVAFSGNCASVLGVNAAEVHGDSTNVDSVWVYHGSGKQTVPDSNLAVIAPRETAARQAVRLLPSDKNSVTVQGFEIYPTTTSAASDSHGVGHVGILAKTPGQGWREVTGVNFRTNGGPVFVYPPFEQHWPVGGLAELRVAAAVTGASTDLMVRVLGK